MFGRFVGDADLHPTGNIFTICRWIFASAVMFSHGFVLTGHIGSDPTTDWLPFPISRLAVLLFFSLSGFLVVGSLVRRGIRDFAVSRALRLIPGLWVMLIFTTCIMGTAVTSLPLSDYFASERTIAYVARNALLLGGAYSLPGVFNAAPYREVVNGSLWTIPQEVRCYLALALIGATGLLASRRWLSAAFVAAIVVHLIVPVDAIPALEQPRTLGLAFLFGALLYLWRDRLFVSWPLALAAVAVPLMLPSTTASELALIFGAAYLTLVVAVLVPATVKRWSQALPDYSYGIYIYGFVAQQAVVASGWGVTPYANMGVAFVLTVACAAASWHLVEKPALGLKRRILRTRPA